MAEVRTLANDRRKGDTGLWPATSNAQRPTFNARLKKPGNPHFSSLHRLTILLRFRHEKFYEGLLAANRDARRNEMKASFLLRSIVRVAVMAAVLLVFSHRLPAPIQEIPETPSPSPVPSATMTPSKPRPARAVLATPAKKPETTPSPVRENAGPYTGLWSGVMYISMFGDTGYAFSIGPSQTSVKMWGTNKVTTDPISKVDDCPASIGADGISWHWNMWRWSLKPYGDGRSALVKIRGPFKNGSAVFQRVN